jgi:putative hydrolase of the HAD superfamily
MEFQIFAICFDVGGTLRIAENDPGRKLLRAQELHQALGWIGSVEDLISTIEQRHSEYENWYTKTLCDLSEEKLWSTYLLPDYPLEFVEKNAKKFNELWRNGRIKKVVPDANATIRELSHRGYQLAIISNTSSSIEAPQLLADMGITDLFTCVLLSATFGRRKPHPSMFIEASRQMKIKPENCAYIGNDVTRDLIGARQAGYGKVVILSKNGYRDDIHEDYNEVGNRKLFVMQPDHRIKTLSDLLTIFPKISQSAKVSHQQCNEPLPQVLYDVAFSTMWGVDQSMPFNQTFIAGREIGFSKFELNHKITQELVDQVDLDHYYISTVHEPCPTEYTYDVLKSRDIAISSLDEPKRVSSVDMVKRSVDLAVRLGSRSVVIHPGSIVCDKSRDFQLRELFLAGKHNTPAYQALRDETLAHRKKIVQPHLDKVMESLEEIIRFSRSSGVSLGLENRYRYYDIPLPDEMELLLDLCQEDWYGFQYDVGHAQTLSVLGLVDHFEWMDRFSDRMIGVHLHDDCGIIDHQVPGMGEVDFNRIAPYIPIQAQRTLEIGPQASLEQISAGLKILVSSGCIEKMSY